MPPACIGNSNPSTVRYGVFVLFGVPLCYVPVRGLQFARRHTCATPARLEGICELPLVLAIILRADVRCGERSFGMVTILMSLSSWYDILY